MRVRTSRICLYNLAADFFFWVSGWSERLGDRIALCEDCGKSSRGPSCV